jgi:hypothetical protein
MRASYEFDGLVKVLHNDTLCVHLFDLILSAAGGLGPGTPAEALDAVVQATR